MRAEDMVLISVDDHVVEPPGMFDGRVPEPQRVAYYAQHLAAARRAIAAGVDLRG